MRDKILITVIALVGAAPAYAVLDQYRTEVQVSSGSGNGTSFSFDGGLNATSAFTDILEPDTNGAKALAELSADGFVPILKILARHGGRRHQAIAWGVQGYTNTSASPLDTSLIMTLTADISGSNDIDAALYLFEDENFEFARGSGTILFESSSQLWPGFEDFANNLGPTGFDIDKKDVTGVVNETRQFDFTVAPGDSFYVWGQLLGTANNPGVVDSFASLSASFTNTAGLEPAATGVFIPLPGAAVLFAPAILVLFGAQTRRRNRRY